VRPLIFGQEVDELEEILTMSASDLSSARSRRVRKCRVARG
jgi:hypothetical protein